MQERDAERRRQLRERARQLIAEARSGVKMSDMSLLDASSAERGNSSKACPAGGQHALTHKPATANINTFLFLLCLFSLTYGQAFIKRPHSRHTLTLSYKRKVTQACFDIHSLSTSTHATTHTFPLCSLKGFCLILREKQNVI